MTTSLIEWIKDTSSADADAAPPANVFKDVKSSSLESEFLKKMTFELGRYVQSGGDVCDLFDDDVALAKFTKILYGEIRSSESIAFFQLHGAAAEETINDAS